MMKKNDIFGDAEKEVIKLVCEFDLDRTKMLEKFEKKFSCANKNQAEAQYLRIQRTILKKINYTGEITYHKFVNIVRQIIIKNAQD